MTDLKKGYFKGYEGTKELHNDNLQDSNYNLEFLPEVVANDGYTFKGWKVTNKAGEEIYNLDANSTSIAFPYGVADDYTVTATFTKDETPVDPVDPVNPVEPTNPEKPANGDKTTTKDKTKKTTDTKKKSAKKADEKKSDTVQTGDHSNVFVYVATLLIAGAAAVVAFFRRRNA